MPHPTTIDSLAIETLSHIFTFLPTTLAEDPGWHRVSVNALLSVALVCKRWSEPAQEQLWSDLRFGRHGFACETIDSLVKSEGTTKKEFRTRELILFGCDETRITNVLGALRGIKSFELCAGKMVDHEEEPVRVNAQILQSASLADVTNLQISPMIEFQPIESTFPLLLPFKLTTLHLTLSLHRYPIPVLSSLLSQPTLSSLNLESVCCSYDDAELYRKTITEYASVITSTHIELLSNDAKSGAEVMAHFASFTRLSHLVCTSPYFPQLQYLPPAVERLTLDMKEYGRDEFDGVGWEIRSEKRRSLIALTQLLNNHKVLEGVKIVEIRLDSAPKFWDVFIELRNICLERNFEVEWCGRWIPAEAAFVIRQQRASTPVRWI